MVKFELKPHPASLISPPLSDNEMVALETSLLQNGQIDDIITYQGMILDGNHKYKILTKLGKNPRLREFELNGVQSPEDYVIGKLQGRQMSIGQKACVCAERIDLLKADPSEHCAKNNVKKKLIKQGLATHSPKSNGHKNKLHIDLANIFLIGTSLISKARTLFLNDMEIFNKVKAGKIAVQTGYVQYRLKTDNKYKNKTTHTIIGQHQNAKIVAEQIVIPQPFESYEKIFAFVKTMNDHGWQLAIKISSRLSYVHWYGNGVYDRQNAWTGYLPDADLKRLIVAEACTLLKMKALKIRDDE